MTVNKLSKRLERVKELSVIHTPAPRRMADIGSDHAHLPIQMLSEELIECAIAGEVAQGPFEAAQREVSQQDTLNKIDVRFGNGLAVIEGQDDINLITICGMGGGIIRDILEAGQQKLTATQTLVLQPNVGESIVRTWLADHRYEIVAEDILVDNGKRYEIIVAKKAITPVKLSAAELLFGPVLMQDQNQVFIEKWQHELHHLQRIQKTLQGATQTAENNERYTKITKQINLIEELLKDE